MKGGRQSRLQTAQQLHRGHGGFTIIEILIVLAVTAALFTSAVLLINGKQRVSSFNQAIHNVQTELQQSINEVGSGYYPNNGNISCTAGGGSGPQLSNAAAPQGTNEACLFIGKVDQFAVGSAAADPQTYNVYTIVGLRGGFNSLSTNFLDSKARVIAKGVSEGNSSIPDAFETKNLLYGLTVVGLYYNGSPANTAEAIGFASNLSSLSASDGSQQINIFAVPHIALMNLHLDKATAVTDINSRLGALPPTALNPPQGVQICFMSGGTQQSGLITIGAGSRAGNVDLKIFSNTSCT